MARAEDKVGTRPGASIVMAGVGDDDYATGTCYDSDAPMEKKGKMRIDKLIMTGRSIVLGEIVGDQM